MSKRTSTKPAPNAESTVDHVNAISAGQQHGAMVRDAAIAAAQAGRNAGAKAVEATRVAKSYVAGFIGAFRAQR